MWYKNNYRRHLCDMHIDDWDEKFLSEFSPQKYFENLKKAKLKNAMLYFQSHVGLCNFPTKSGRMHNAFSGREDSMKQLSELCRKNGITVTGYYSLIYNNWAHDHHPDWRMVDETGKSKKETNSNIYAAFANNDVFRYGLCCPNNEDYREFLREQIKEMAEYFEVDGMFYDMPFWPHICLCDSCKKRWLNEVGGEIPTERDWKDEGWLLHVAKRREWMGEFISWVTKITKEYMPGVSVEHNLASAVYKQPLSGCAEEVNNECDYVGGDLYGDSFSHSFVCKFYRNITKNQPFEYMFSKCENLQRHTSMKTEDEMLSSVLLTSAHHGATLVIDAIDPTGEMDFRLYERLERVFEKTEPYEKYFEGEMIEDIGIYNSFKSRFNARNEPYNNHDCTVALVKKLVEENVPCGVTGGWSDLNKYKVLVAPCLTEQDNYDVERIAEYVKDGGNLYFSGGDNAYLLKEFFGATVTGYSKEHVVYIAPKESEEKYFEGYSKRFPLHFDGYAPVADGADEEKVMATITMPYTSQDVEKFVSIHSNPPGIETGIPAMLFTEYGKGKVIWSALPIEAIDYYEYKKILLNLLLDKFGVSLSATSAAPETVELVSFKAENYITVSCVKLNVCHKAEIVNGFQVAISSERAPGGVELLPGGEPIEFTYSNGRIMFKTKDLNIFDMYKINF